MSLIYIVEDDLPLQKELSKLLKLNDYEVVSCADFKNAACEVAELSPDLVILDLNLPGTDGQTICREIRSSESSKEVPIIILTSSNDEFTEVMSLNLGAHDFITKPYRPAVLLARIASLLKHTSNATSGQSTINYAGVTLNMSTSEVSHQGQSALLTRNELRILSLLMKNPETIISRQEIMCDLWETDAFIDDNTLTVNVNRLRKTLSGIGVPTEFLQTRRSLGYVVTASGNR